MSKKHNAKHESRGVSNYPARLADRGLSRTPMMPFIDSNGRKHGTIDACNRADQENARRRHGGD